MAILFDLEKTAKKLPVAVGRSVLTPPRLVCIPRRVEDNPPYQ